MAQDLLGHPIGAPVYLDDLRDALSAREPGSVAGSGTDSPDGWRIEEGMWGARNGDLIVCGPGAQAATLRFRLNHAGPHAIFVGAYSAGTPKHTYDGRETDEYGVYVKLSTQTHYTFLQPERWEPSYQEMYFTMADTTDLELEITNFQRRSAVDYIKLVPLREIPRSKPSGYTIGILDFADDATTARPRGREAASAIRQHADVGYDAVWWKSYAVRCEYRTTVGERRRGPGVGELLDEYDTLQQATEEAHKAGIAIYGWARISNEFTRQQRENSPKGWYNHFSPDTRFHLEHPHSFQIDRSGNQTPKLSFADPNVRRHKIEILKEIARYGVDGIAIDVLRHPPMADYDHPLVETFIVQHGCDPRTLPNDGSEAWLRFRSTAFTQFLREARAELDRQAQRRFPLVVRTVDQEWRNLQIGCDVETWIDEGLVDGIILGPHCATGADYPEEMDLTHYVKSARDTQTKVWGQVWRMGSGRHAEALARDLYEQGADGVALYESNFTVAQPSLRQRLWRFNHPSLLSRA